MYIAIKEMVKDNEAQVAFIEAQIAAIDKRNDAAKAKRDAKRGAAAEFMRDKIVEVLTDAGRAITLAEVTGAIEGATAAKVTYYMRGLVDDGTVVKDKVKVGDRKIMSYRVAE